LSLADCRAATATIRRQDERQSSRDISDNRKQLARRTNRERSCPRYRPPPSTLIAAAVSPRLTRHNFERHLIFDHPHAVRITGESCVDATNDKERYRRDERRGAGGPQL
jgi:hypothetical protein